MPGGLRLKRSRKLDSGSGLARGNGRSRMRMISSKVKGDAAAPFMELITKQDGSRQLTDPFDSVYGLGAGVGEENQIIQPLYDPGRLIRVGMQNSALNQCIDAYVVNIESYGYQLEYIGPPAVRGQDNSGEQSSEAQRQKKMAMSFLDMPNGDITLRSLRESSRKDLEYVGYRYFEVARDAGGRIVYLNHVPSTTMRMTRKDKDPTPYILKVPDPDGDGFVEREFVKYFRRYVQVGANGDRVFFKEFGDPRSIDPKNGNVNNDLDVEDQATEVFMHGLYMPGTPYGVPRWIGVIPSLLGIRESELVNLNFFRENAIPAMAVLISGGLLTNESFDNVTNIINAARGKDAMNRILILEAASDDSAGGVDQAPPAPKIEMNPMISERQQDGLFKDYEVAGTRKIRSSMRLPAIYTGDSEEYTKATAQAGQRIAESQVFFPERSLFDEFVNMRILPTWEIDLWRYKTMGPTTYDPDTLGNMVDKFAKHGALTPNILIKIANATLDVQITPIAEEYGDVPMVYSLALANNGRVWESFEDILAPINDASAPIPGEQDPAAANDDTPAAVTARVIRQLRSELHAVTTDLIDRVNEAVETIKGVAA